MRTDTGDLFTYQADAICITTNGILRRNGRAVMGAGVARQARDRYPGIDLTLGKVLSTHGNVATIIRRPDADESRYVLSFPTKHDWRDPSPLRLIERSAEQLLDLADAGFVSSIALPPPGCGHGGLSWDGQVRPLLQSILDDRFVIVSPRRPT